MIGTLIPGLSLFQGLTTLFTQDSGAEPFVNCVVAATTRAVPLRLPTTANAIGSNDHALPNARHTAAVPKLFGLLLQLSPHTIRGVPNGSFAWSPRSPLRAAGQRRLLRRRGPRPICRRPRRGS